MASLLSEFPPIRTETWEKAIRDDLKGADYADKLIWRSPEGIDVKPYYRAEDLAGLEFVNTAPGEFPYVRGTRGSGGWRIREEIDIVDAEEANSAARCAAAAGAEEIAFTRAVVANASDLGILVANLGEIPIRFEDASATTVRLVLERMTVRQSGTMRSTDRDWRADPAFSADAISKAPTGFVPFTIRAEEFQEGGASAVEEVGYALAAGVDFLAEMQQRGVSIDRAADSIIFSFAMGPEYFMQIAKLRAFRMAWAQVVRTFGGSRDHAKAQIYARSAQWDRTIYDPQVNMLRATTEAMSAVLGGADSVCVAPFDGCYRQANDSSRRLARNTQIILKQEAQLARVADPGGGSYYLEALTDSIARKAWKLLQDVEASGVDGKAADSIAQTLAVRKTAQDKAVVNRHRVLTGTNRFADPKERALDRIDYPFTNDTSRAAAPFEELRLRTESWIAKTGQGPRIVLAEIGDPKMRAARSNFVADFLACAGLVTEIKQFGAAAQIGAAEANLIVVCSSDPEYVAIATEMLAEMRSRGSEVPVLIAGNPESSEQLRAAGITDFIHLRSNPIELLTRLQKILGIGK